MTRRKCIDCFSSSQVLDSRYSRGSVRRRRRCKKCGGRFTTDEIERKVLRDLHKTAGVPTEAKNLIETLYKLINGDTEV